MLALPGSSYLHQGEEMGLPEVDVAPEHRQDPAWLRGGARGRDGCRVPLPWSGTAAPFGFDPDGSEPWIPQPAGWSRLTVAAQEGAEDSTLEFYRTALTTRRAFASDAGDDVQVLEAGEHVLAFHRGVIALVLNCGSAPVPLPEGEVLIASGPLSGDLLPPDTAVWLRRDQPPTETIRVATGPRGGRHHAACRCDATAGRPRRVERVLSTLDVARPSSRSRHVHFGPLATPGSRVGAADDAAVARGTGPDAGPGRRRCAC